MTQLPPRVAQARAELGWDHENIIVVADTAQVEAGAAGPGIGGLVGMGNPGSGEPVLLDADRLVRRRQGGPLQPDPAEEQTRPRPSLKRALEIANSPELVHRARLGYQQLSYAAGTIDTKNSLFRAWCEILGQHDLAPVPLTIEKCQLFCSIRISWKRGKDTSKLDSALHRSWTCV